MAKNRNSGTAAMKSSSVVLFPQPALQLIYDTAPIGLACLSPDCRYLQINQRLTEICGISVEDHLGRTVRDCVPALAGAVEDIVRSIMESGEPVTGIEVTGQRADQTDERFWITYWHPLRSPSGEIVGVSVAAEEITERKRAEAALLASEQQTRRARDTAEAALQNLRDTQNSLIEAEKLAALGRLVAGVAHEINSPVGTSLTVASALERKTDMIVTELAQGVLKRSSLSEFLETSRKASLQLVANLSHAAELIQSFKQVATDRSQSNQRVFDLGDLTEQVVQSLRPGLGKQNLTLEVECESDLAIDSYPGPYGLVLTNLFLNSVAHAFPDGKGGIIDIKVRSAGKDKVEIVLSDNGCGMTSEVRRNAFEPFFTTRRDQGSTGLGLHIVHNVSVIYVTERCVFRLTSGQLELIEVAPGVDVERDILDKMNFRPTIRAVRQMSAKIFQHGRMDLRSLLEDLDLSDRLAYDRDRNILFLNFEGLRVRRPEDIETIRAAVAERAAQIGGRVAAVVNYDAFHIDEDVAQQYAAMVRDLEESHYTKVSRYTTSAFMRIKLGEHLRRTVRPHIFENRADAHAFHEKSVTQENVI